jgi:hypothetical protein
MFVNMMGRIIFEVSSSPVAAPQNRVGRTPANQQARRLQSSPPAA